MAGFNTVKTYALDGTTKAFNITFDYLARQHIIVSIVKDDGTRQVLALGTDYRFTTTTTIETTVIWGVAGDGAASIELKRQTPADKAIVNFQDGSILRSADLNLSNIQSIYIAEEARELANEGIGVDINGQLDARNRKIINLAPGDDPTDAINKQQLEDGITGASAIVGQAQAQAQAAAGSASDAATSASQAQTSQQAALLHADTANQASNAAVQARNAAQTAQTGAETAETNAQNSAAASEASALRSEAAAQRSANSASQSAASATNAQTFSLASGQSAIDAKNQADRAKTEADKIAGQNALTNAITGVGPTPDFKVDFKSMPSVKGIDIVQQLTTGGFQVNSDLVCKTDATGGTLNDDKFAGKSFMCEKPDPTATTNGITLNHAPALMEYDQALVVDFYGLWTPSAAGSLEGKTRVQLMFDKNAIWVRGYHLENQTWTPWKRVGSQFYTNVSGMDVETVVSNGSYYYLKDTATVITTNVPKIDPPEDSDVYFLEVNSSDDEDQVVQTVHSPKTNTTFNRYRVNGTWSRWWNTTATFDVDTAPAGMDINKTVNPGLWGFDVQTMLNRPSWISSGDTGTLIVEIIATAKGLCVQKAYRPSPLAQRGVIWTRSCTNPEATTPTWNGWTNLVQQDTVGNIAVNSVFLVKSTPTQDGEAASKKYVDEKTKNASGGFLGEVQWFINRTFLADGFIPADGQLLDRSAYPDFAKLIVDGLLPATSEATWLAGAVNGANSRGLYTAGDSTQTKFRMPDLNGAAAGSINAPFLRGDGGGNRGNGWNNGNIQYGAIDNVPGQFEVVMNTAGYAQNGFTQTDGNVNNTKIATTALSGAKNNRLTYDPSKVNALYRNGVGELRPNSVVGCWAIRVANAPSAIGTVDVNGLATRIESINSDLSAKIKHHEEWTNAFGPEWSNTFIFDANTPKSTPELWVNQQGNLLRIRGIIRHNTGWTAQTSDATQHLFRIVKLPNGYTKARVLYTPALYSPAVGVAGGTPKSGYVNQISATATNAATGAIELYVNGNAVAAGMAANQKYNWIMVDVNVVLEA